MGIKMNLHPPGIRKSDTQGVPREALVEPGEALGVPREALGGPRRLPERSNKLI